MLRLGFVETDESDDDGGDLSLLLYSELVRMPKDELLPFYRSILELNANPLRHGRLAIQEDVVVYMAVVGTGLLDDKLGAALLVNTLVHEADELDDLLIEEFGAQAIGD
jgi:hypothetical protein